MGFEIWYVVKDDVKWLIDLNMQYSIFQTLKKKTVTESISFLLGMLV